MHQVCRETGRPVTSIDIDASGAFLHQHKPAETEQLLETLQYAG